MKQIVSQVESLVYRIQVEPMNRLRYVLVILFVDSTTIEVTDTCNISNFNCM